ncbi:hypothetical protein, partial [Bartonella schoenbuchensis]|uniref:hypothetical protein n=1 Tax=Bartonella schoenbuchensis TaxID=165694 RepID=UPI001ABBA1F7
MVMRRVLKHHVCLCVLSTAVLAGLALSTAQEVYAQSQNCNGGVAGSGGSGSSGSSDSNNGRIECDKSSGGNRKPLEGVRTVDMGTESGGPAVKVYGGADITISSEMLKITGGGGNNEPAIKVYGQGKLTVMNVTATDVYKGIVVSGGGSSVTVVKGSIGLRESGVAVIEVNGTGDVTLVKGVTVTVTGGGSGGRIHAVGMVFKGSGKSTVMLMGTSFQNVKTGVSVEGSESLTMTLTDVTISEVGAGVYVKNGTLIM